MSTCVACDNDLVVGICPIHGNLTDRVRAQRANDDGWYDAWRGWRADPMLLNDERYADDYMDGYREGTR